MDAVRDASEKRPKHTSQYDEGASERSNEEMLRPRKSYKAILFDLDGVLVNMPDGHYEALNRALALFGVKIEREEHMRMFNGLPTRKKIEELEKAGRLPTGLKEFINAVKQKHTKEIIPKYCPPDYSKIILLQHLKNRGLKLACCTNSIRETTHLMLKSAHLFDFFDLIIGNDEVKNPKPHPETYLYTFEKLGVEPHECLIIEDAPPGIASARASGAFVIEVRGPEDVNLALFEKILNF
ncbi:MAG: HAD-superfamily hydrolase, subfamily IA, variant 3 [Parcubacteria group bacterium GW2011_GWA2_47_16]|nr:MAG: HAD-superfamily hydrolase, subfamily IA, variant 3 [Parcubacteria group bacterium GW2011_GWA2_47_16]